jgi:penicillin-binding protein 2
MQQRLITGVVVVGLMVVALLFRMAFMQTIQHDRWLQKSENNRIRIQPVIPKRGLVYDRERKPLVENRASYTLSVVPHEIRNNETMDRLSSLFETEVEEIEKRMRKNQNGAFQPAPIRRNVDFAHVAVLEEQNERFPGTLFREDQVRLYAESLGVESFSGYVGEISEEEKRNLDPNLYRSGTMIGKAGIEKQYDRMLRGLEGTEYVEITAAGQILGELEERAGQPAEPGSDLVLTIDKDIQTAAYNSFDEFCCGAAIAIDPRNGEILALVSKPSLDPNIFSGVIPDTLWHMIISDTTNPLLNRPLDGMYPPGSPYKLLVAGASLELDLIDRNSVFATCNGYFRFGNRSFGCWDKAGHGQLAVVQAIAQSCDVYFYQLGIKLGFEEYAHFSRLCGFGKPTGVDLPQEASGLVPDPAWYDNRYGKGKWTRALILNLAIGQGEMLVTPLQLAQFYCGLANDGKVYRPHLLRSTIAPDGRESSRGGELAFTLPFTRRTLDILKEGLIEVVQGEHGTARGSRISGVIMGGKTGTAQNPHGEDHAWFVGFAPADNPEIVACVLVENAGHGSEWDAPGVKKIISAYLQKHDIIEAPIATAGGLR